LVKKCLFKKKKIKLFLLFKRMIIFVKQKHNFF